MGVGSYDLEVILKLRRNGILPGKFSIAEIGAQQLGDSVLAATSGGRGPHRGPAKGRGHSVRAADRHVFSRYRCRRAHALALLDRLWWDKTDR
jgi:hypothetical protein